MVEIDVRVDAAWDEMCLTSLTLRHIAGSETFSIGWRDDNDAWHEVKVWRDEFAIALNCFAEVTDAASETP